MKPVFSIIIPVYNVAPYLRECLDSVLAQTFGDWEAICVDDGSTDGSGAILDEYAAKDNRFRVVHKANGGVGSARNVGLDAARGEWMLFLDGDDVWSRYLLEYVGKGVEEYPGERLFRFSYENFDRSIWTGPQEPPARGFRKIDISRMISYRDFFFFFFCCYAYRRDLFDGMRFPTYVRGEDRCVINQIQLERVNCIVGSESVLYGYRKRAGSAMNSFPSIRAIKDEILHRLDLLELIDGSGKSCDQRMIHQLETWLTDSAYYWISRFAKGDTELLAVWRKSLKRMVKMKVVSFRAKVKAYSRILLPFAPCNELFCYIIPSALKGGSPMRYIRAKLTERGREMNYSHEKQV